MALVKEDLRHYLEGEIFTQLAPPPYMGVETRQLTSSKPVYLFTERSKHISVVGKCFKHHRITLQKAWEMAENEYHNMEQARALFGTNSNGCRIVRPMGKNRELSAMLVMENVPGNLLDHYIVKAIYRQQPDCLYEKLSALSRLLAMLHRNSETGSRVSPDPPRWYLGKLLDTLAGNPLGRSDRRAIETLADAWFNEPDVFDDREVIVHGDATPTNFLFNGTEVTCIDLEKMKHADRCWDLGFMAAELKHHFIWRTGNGQNAEPFIGHFLWQYAFNYGNETLFYSVTRKLPLYMALGLLRIARNRWLDDAYRNNLVGEARQCLKYRS